MLTTIRPWLSGLATLAGLLAWLAAASAQEIEIPLPANVPSAAPSGQRPRPPVIDRWLQGPGTAARGSPRDDQAAGGTMQASVPNNSPSSLQGPVPGSDHAAGQRPFPGPQGLLRAVEQRSDGARPPRIDVPGARAQGPLLGPTRDTEVPPQDRALTAPAGQVPGSGLSRGGPAALGSAPPNPDPQARGPLQNRMGARALALPGYNGGSRRTDPPSGGEAPNIDIPLRGSGGPSRTSGRSRTSDAAANPAANEAPRSGLFRRSTTPPAPNLGGSPSAGWDDNREGAAIGRSGQAPSASNNRFRLRQLWQQRQSAGRPGGEQRGSLR